MSRAFVKEDGADSWEPVKRQPSGRPNYVTRAGLEQLRARAAELAALRASLVERQRPDEARGHELRQAEADLAYYEGQLKSARLTDNSAAAGGAVMFGASVRVRGADGAEREYVIVGEDESDPPSGRLNWASPLAAALLGRKAGDRVPFGRGGAVLEIISVSYPGAARA